MKLQFERDLDYQLQAIESVCDLFRGQEACRTEFTVSMKLSDHQLTLGVAETDLGIGNRLSLLDDQLLKNLQDVQLRNGLAPSGLLASGDFTVEMETGTGKTYVYLRTIFELNKRYGFTKFVIVVPSVAIKEGVYKSLQITEEHFKDIYAGVPVELLPVRLQQAGAGTQLRYQLDDSGDGGDGWRHQQEGGQQPLQRQRKDGRRKAD
ncbi:MAG: DEAD/DEAH box helicase family protein [Rhodocyclaceae bacterium]